MGVEEATFKNSARISHQVVIRPKNKVQDGFWGALERFLATLAGTNRRADMDFSSSSMSISSDAFCRGGLLCVSGTEDIFSGGLD